MTVLIYLLVPILVVAIAASVTWARNRQPTSLESGVDSFRREMQALSPDADPRNRRRAEPGRPSSNPRPGPPRRQAGPDEDA